MKCVLIIRFNISVVSSEKPSTVVSSLSHRLIVIVGFCHVSSALCRLLLLQRTPLPELFAEFYSNVAGTVFIKPSSIISVQIVSVGCLSRSLGLKIIYKTKIKKKYSCFLYVPPSWESRDLHRLIVKHKKILSETIRLNALTVGL